MKRREFIQSSATLAVGTIAGAGGASTIAAAATPKATVQKYKTVGRTDIKMSDISFGAGRLNSRALILRAIDRGINYFDTAPDYGKSEIYIGEALKRFRQRDKIYIASKYCTNGGSGGHLPTGSSKSDYINAVDASLKRLGTDYLDVVFVHAMGTDETDFTREKKRLLDDNMLEATESLKKAGKIRYLATSSHGPNNMEKLLLEAVRSGHFDLIMPAFNFMKFPRVPELLQEAKQRGVGVVAMKTLAGARDSGAELEPGKFEQAAFKWVLSHPEVDGLIISIKSVRHLDDYLPASGGAFAGVDQQLLDRYAALHGDEYCRTGCGDCGPGCPEGVDIAAILRYQMYFENYGEEKRAMLAYAGLEKNAANCLDCADDGCSTSCTYGLDVGAKLRSAHRTLSMEV
jgi:uncharacterized protein